MNQESLETMAGPGLWVVATPLGNAGDLSPRAARILSHADVILAEDTRRAGLLFKRLGIEREGGLVSFFEHNEDKKLPAVLEWLEQGRSIALISDAGTPLLSDPGYRLVRACRERGFPVSPVPGPSAPLAALSACGLPPLPFSFLGFPPRKDSQLQRFFEAHRDTGATLVFFERKSRLETALHAARDVLGDREFCIARELTKDFEEFISGSLGSLDAVDFDLRGEITVVIGPAREEDKASSERVLALVEEEQEGGGKPKEIARRVAGRVKGWTAKEIYALMSR
ncbi:16S rRNA (cytidine(1402)-2'-O)-methyltransferase [Salidesulfovibrio onnuriiensis]|uniref:16S rRNA (cytidine(1402)-2'-O)-methyltransferase n=1 Tax=Salidesulfovibrio onnuriiensis TaxID=2583823 RepID=UPI00202B8923|nr:16S rRNA (cytidine(1402)-2'-O)-methyltransferase [Salidesulfovibrio onnuriiensis]